MDSDVERHSENGAETRRLRQYGQRVHPVLVGRQTDGVRRIQQNYHDTRQFCTFLGHHHHHHHHHHHYLFI